MLDMWKGYGSGISQPLAENQERRQDPDGNLRMLGLLDNHEDTIIGVEQECTRW